MFGLIIDKHTCNYARMPNQATPSIHVIKVWRENTSRGQFPAWTLKTPALKYGAIFKIDWRWRVVFQMFTDYTRVARVDLSSTKGCRRHITTETELYIWYTCTFVAKKNQCLIYMHAIMFYFSLITCFSQTKELSLHQSVSRYILYTLTMCCIVNRA